jgi:hypothetical protein
LVALHNLPSAKTARLYPSLNGMRQTCASRSVRSDNVLVPTEVGVSTRQYGL